MCDDLTDRDLKRRLEAKRLGRREFSALSVGVTAAWLIPGCDSDESSASSPDAGNTADAAAEVATTKSSLVQIKTDDGTADAFFVHPESGKHPAVLVWPDILGLREAFESMATRLAERGYAVLVLNQYYRTAPAPLLTSWEEWQSDEGKAKLMPAVSALSPETVTRDAAALIDWLDDQAAVDTNKKVGSTGYCMGGPFTIRTAASRPERVGAIGSFHGGGLVTTEDNSPHLLFPDIDAALLIAIAENDDERQPEAKDTLKEAAESADLAAEIEVYPALHGWCPPDAPAYDETQANKAFDRLLAVFSEHL